MGHPGEIDDNHGEQPGGMPARLSMAVLSAGDLPLLRAFYRALGWPERSGGTDTLSIFQLGDVALALYPSATTPDGTEAEVRSAVTLVVTVETRAAVDNAYTAAVAAGAQSVVDPEDQPWGGRSGVLADPEGNRWEVLWVPTGAEDG
jgi:predicted lactoylglutathione lyase